MSKTKKAIIITVSSFLALILAFMAVYFLWPWNKSFFDVAVKEFAIPGLDTSFTPQGFTKLQENDKYVISGYMSDGGPSRFYVVDKDNDNENKYFTLDIDGKEYDGHAGGIVSFGSSLWVVGDDLCVRFMLTDVLKVDNGEKVYAQDFFKPLSRTDFVFANDGLLWIGEFYREGNYETRKHHKIETSSGEINPAIVYGYEIDESTKIGLTKKIPTKALSIRGLCQGMDMTIDGKFVMSTSYSLLDSHIYYYNNVLESENESTIRYDLHTIPLWILDDNDLIGEIKAPSMSEEMVVENGRVYILFESACKKYRLYNRKRLKNVYSVPINALEA